MTTYFKKIFTVDDEPLLTEMLIDYVKEQDNGDSLEIETFPTGEACLKKLYEAPDLVLLDYYLNLRERDAANGIDILKSLKDKNKTLPVIMLSSQKNYAIAAKTILYGTVPYVIKGQDAFGEIYKIIKANT